MNHNEFNRNDDRDQARPQLSDELAEDLAAYAMGALEPNERRALEAQIKASPTLQARLQALSMTVDTLAYSAPQIAPPPAAKARLLARVEAERKSQAGVGQRGRPPVVLGARQFRRNPLRQVQQRVQQRAQRQAQPWFDLATGWKLATIATASALLIFIAAAYSIQRELNQVSGNLAAAQAALTTLRTANAELQQRNLALSQQFSQQRLQLASLVDADQIVPLAGNEPTPLATGALFVGADSLTLLVDGLTPLSAEQTYELWLIPQDSDPIPSGLVTLTEIEGPNLIAGLPRNAETFAAVGLSIEPAGGSDQPTGPIVLLGTRTEPS